MKQSTDDTRAAFDEKSDAFVHDLVTVKLFLTDFKLQISGSPFSSIFILSKLVLCQPEATILPLGTNSWLLGSFKRTQSTME